MTDDDRHESFKELDTKTQFRLFMSQPVGTKKLPPVPKDWGKREQQAVEKTILHTRDPGIAEDHFGVSVEKPNSDSEDSEDNYAKASGATTPMQEYEAFVRALHVCVPMMMGFHAKDGESKSCYCPCSKSMKKWREFCSLDSTEESFCGMTGKDCREFLQHAHDVSTPLIISEKTKTHYIIYQYLKSVFKNYCRPGNTQQHWPVKSIENGKGQIGRRNRKGQMQK
jgi:hypothetical protein